jgi:hypothetical protein
MPAEVHSQFADDLISFTIDPEVAGIIASGTFLFISPGSLTVKIHLPDGFTDGGIEWVDSSGSTPVTQPGVVTDVRPEDTWVEIDLNNDLSVTEQFFFQLTGNQDTRGKFGPVIRSDPPPSLIVESF